MSSLCEVIKEDGKAQQRSEALLLLLLEYYNDYDVVVDNRQHLTGTDAAASRGRYHMVLGYHQPSRVAHDSMS